MKTPWRKLYILALAGAISWLGSEMTTFAVILRDKDTIGAAGVSFYLLAFAVPNIVMAPVSGWVADRFSSRQVILPALVVMGLGSFSLALGFPIWWTPCALAITAFAGTLVSPSLQAAQVTITLPEDLARVTGMMQSFNAAGMLFAPALGGILVSATGYIWPFVIDGASFWLLAAVFMLLNINRKSVHHETGEKLSALAGLKFVFGNASIRALVILVSILVITLSTFFVGEVFLVKDELHASTLIYGIVGALFAGGNILGNVAAAAIKLPEKFHAVASLAGMLLISFTILGFSQVTSWLVAMVLALFTGISNAFLNTYAISIIMTRSPTEALGRVNAVVGAFINTGFLVGVLLSGIAISSFTVRPVLLVGALLSLCVVFIFGPAVLKAEKALPN